MLRLVAIVWLFTAPILSEISPEQQLSNKQDGNLEPTGHEAEKHIGVNLEIRSAPLNRERRRYIRGTRFFEIQRYLMDETDLDYDSSTENMDFLCTSDFAFLADPDGNCSVYYACHHGFAERRMCKGRLHFNRMTKLCDYPNDAFCDLKCPQRNDRLHVPWDCNMYLECNASVGKYVRCPGGLHYNAVTKLCDNPANAACRIKCPDYDTFVALPGRCNMYASCQKGIATNHLCQGGFHFNPYRLQCYLSKEEECDPQCLKPNGYFPVLGQCNSYIQCINNHPKVFTCPSGLHFNFYLRSCDIPSEEGCGFKCKELYGFFPFPGVCTYYFKCLNGIAFLQRCKGEMEFNQDLKQCDFTVKDSCLPYCPESNGLFPIEKRCDHYIRCVNGYGIVKRCPPGLHYNAIFEYCDFPEYAKCNPECPQSLGLFPLPGRCNEYFVCENYITYLRTCGRGLHFNARTQTCEWPAIANCKISCPQQEGYFPIQGDCNAFVKCNDGHPTRRRCPDGKEFNVYSTSCELPEDSDCELSCLGDDIVEAFPGYCDAYLLCIDRKPYVDTCSPGLLFNSYTNACDFPENVNCSAWLL